MAGAIAGAELQTHTTVTACEEREARTLPLHTLATIEALLQAEGGGTVHT